VQWLPREAGGTPAGGNGDESACGVGGGHGGEGCGGWVE
jgi:hypothetical protein